MRGHNPIIIISLVVACLTCRAVDIPLIELGPGTEMVTAAGNFAFCHAPEESQCTEYALTLLTTDVLSRGFNKGSVTLQARLLNTAGSSGSFMLEMGNPSLNRVLVRILSGQDTLYDAAFSDLIPFDRRPFFHRNYMLPFELAPMQEVLLRITIEPQRESVFLPIRISSERHYLRSSALDFLLIGGISGMYTIYIIFIIGLFLLWKNKLFLYYALIDLFVLTYCLFDTGYGFQHLWPSFPVFQKMMVPVIAFAYLMAVISFTREFFSTKFKYPALDRLMVAYLVITVLVFIAVVVLYNFIGTGLAVPLLLLVIVFTAFGLTVSVLGSVTYMQSGRREGFWFLLLLSLYFILFAMILNQKGYFGFYIVRPDSALYYHLPIFTGTPHYIFDMMIAEMLIVSTVIAFRFQDVLEEYNVTRRRIEDVNRNSIKALIQGQEVEREALSVTLERRIGLDLASIEHDLNRLVRKNERGGPGLADSLVHLHNVREDLSRVASDFVVDWGSAALPELIERVFNELRSALPNTNVDVTIDPGLGRLNMSELTSLNLYRILQEACNNIIKHSGAQNVRARFNVLNGELEAIIEDDGVGFDIKKEDLKSGIGLRNMETRILAVNGKIAISEAPDGGTRIRLKVPRGGKKWR